MEEDDDDDDDEEEEEEESIGWVSNNKVKLVGLSIFNNARHAPSLPTYYMPLQINLSLARGG